MFFLISADFRLRIAACVARKVKNQEMYIFLIFRVLESCVSVDFCILFYIKKCYGVTPIVSNMYPNVLNRLVEWCHNILIIDFQYCLWIIG